MLSRADISTVHAVEPVVSLTPLTEVGDARQQSFQRALAGQIGKSMQGEVLSKLTDGSFIVKVGGASARMLLPAGVAVGAEVPLTLVSLSPRPTFQITSGAGAQLIHVYSEAGPALLPGPPGAAARAAPLAYLEGMQVEAQAPSAAPSGPAAGAAQPAPLAAGRPLSYAAALLGKAPLTPAALLPALDADSGNSASLSNTARVITAVLGAALKTGNAPTAIMAGAPLVAAPATPVAQVAQALRDAIGKSGLFYESHLAAWSDGKLPIAELAAESQLRSSAAPSLANPAASPEADPAAAQFINLQLSAQEQSSVAWQGQVWPGQQMEWNISKDNPRQQAGGGEQPDQAGWRSALRLRFALLGEVGASLLLADGRLQIQLEAPSDAVGDMLRAHAAGLGAALEAAGIALSSLGVHTAPPADG